MTLTGIRQHSAVLFVAVMLAHVILISAQVNSRSGVPVLETVTFTSRVWEFPARAILATRSQPHTP